jgi:hypothetical protein
MKTGQTGKGTLWALSRDDYCLYVNDGILELAGRSSTLRAVGGPLLNDGTWHHVAAVYPGGPATLKDAVLYIDGRPVAAEADRPGAGVRTGVRGEIYVGANKTGLENPYHGSLDDLGLWVRALSDDEIASLHAAAGERNIKYNAAQMDSLFSLFRTGTGEIRVKGTLWMVTDGLTGSPGDLVLDSNGQYQLILDAEGNGLSTLEIFSR